LCTRTQFVGSRFHVFAPGHVFGGAEGVGSRFHVLRCQTHFRRFRERRVQFYVLRSRTRFRRCGGRRVPFSYFALPDTFSEMRRALGPVFMFCAPELIFGGTEDVGSLFHVLRAQTRFRRYRGRHVPFSCFALLDSFSAVRRASAPVFMFCALRLLSDGTEGIESGFHVLRACTHFRRYRGCRVPFSSFALPDSFSAVPWASSSVFMFCAPKLIFDGTNGVRFCFHVFASGHVFGGAEGVGSHSNV
jgi:hypothetical protein